MSPLRPLLLPSSAMLLLLLLLLLLLPLLLPLPLPPLGVRTNLG